MPIHDWTRVPAGIYHHFHHAWIEEIARNFNRGLLPPGHYALAEQITGGLGPDVVTLQVPGGLPPAVEPAGGIVLAVSPPRVRYRFRAERDQYAAKAKAVVIRHASDHQVVAVVEIVSPGNKDSRHAVRAFVKKAVELLQAGIHLLIVDLFPPTERDPEGLPKAIWDELIDNDFALPADRRLSLAAYIGGPVPETFIEPTAVGQPQAEMPLFLTPDVYVSVPLEATYQSAWEAVPAFWRDALAGTT